MDRDVLLAEDRVDHEAVGRVDDLLLAEVEHHEVLVHLGAALDLLDGLVLVGAVQLHALLHVGRLEDLVDRESHALVDQLHHELVVRDAEVAEAAEARARVHQEAEQDPAVRGEDLVGRELSGVGLVDRVHHLLRHVREALRAAEVVVHDARGRVGAGDHHVIRLAVLDPLRLARVMVEREVRGSHVGKVRGDVALGDLDLAVLHVLRMDEQDVVEDLELLQQGCANEPVEVAAGHEAVLLLGGLPSKLDHGVAIGRGAEGLECVAGSLGQRCGPMVRDQAGAERPQRSIARAS